MGFTFDDENLEAMPIAEMHRLIAENPRNAERIFPYVGGEEVNDSPTHEHRRYVINFKMMAEAQAREGWPTLMRILEGKVQPQRFAQNREVRARYWWRFGEPTPGLYQALSSLDRTLVVAQVSPHGAFTFVSARQVLSMTLNVFPIESNAVFAVLQSRVHEIWARFLGLSMKDDLRYTPSDCFETFPFAQCWVADETLEEIGRAYYQRRAALMIAATEGLTKTYNRFHDPDERNADILRLRELHEQMDRAVLDAYGWSDIPTRCELLLAYEDDEPQADDSAGPRRRKKPWRYRWPDDVRDEVLARLLELNRRRAVGLPDPVVFPAPAYLNETPAEPAGEPSVAGTGRD